MVSDVKEAWSIGAATHPEPAFTVPPKGSSRAGRGPAGLEEVRVWTGGAFMEN